MSKKQKAAPATTENTSAQRNELHNALWNAANELRNNLDGWDFKVYTMSMLVYRYLSEFVVFKINEAGRLDDPNFEYKEFKGTEKCSIEDIFTVKVPVLGFCLKPELLFENVFNHYAKTKSEELATKLTEAFNQIDNSSKKVEKAQKVFSDMFQDLDFNSPKLGKTPAERNARLAKLMKAVKEAKFPPLHDQHIDSFGDAYEFLMHMYASRAGKSGGEYFTPQEVSQLVSELATLGLADWTSVYDPCCGSGSMLLRAARLAPEGMPVSFYGQEKNSTTYNLARMNMVLHSVAYDRINLELGDTLYAPAASHKDKKFKVIISNPPYSLEHDKELVAGLNQDDRFKGIAVPKSVADFAFIFHCLYHLDKEGTCALVLPNGCLNRPTEKKQREYLLKQNVVDAVISLPANIFFGTGTKTSILVLKKNRTSQDQNVLFVDASKLFEPTETGGKKSKKFNRLTQAGIEQVLNAYKNREDLEGFSRLVSVDQIMNSSSATLVANFHVNAIDGESIGLGAELTSEEIMALKTELQSAHQNSSRSNQSCEALLDWLNI